ncbi:hypothetical protein EKO04_011620 [Ascochyta lentis]|uniref:RNase III domain-containing protein n=1 Tax=Ascochyta lentis TaxID=205686 RepID=A0A8H7MBA8_9PLEO|nr:hypothetical protein EKO04_011620 [Ascochyta lentis]
MSNLDSLQARLHYSFKNASLLEEALNAAGAAVSSRDVDSPASGNKRLALVGDAVLRLSVLDEWYPCGGSTGSKETGHDMVKDAGTNERLQEVAKEWDLPALLQENAVWVDCDRNLAERPYRIKRNGHLLLLSKSILASGLRSQSGAVVRAVCLGVWEQFESAGNNDPDDTPQYEVDDRPNDLLSSDCEETPEFTVQVGRKADNGAENVFRGKNHAGLDEHGDREDDIDAINSDGSNNKRSMQEKPKKPISDEELKKICQTLASKTLKKWKVKQRKEKKSLEALLPNWPTFFGHTSCASLGQWSYQALDTSEKFGGLQRPFHKMGLADWWNGCLKRRTSENTTTRIKARMVSALDPGFEKLDSKEKEAKRKKIDRYVLQGEIISSMFSRGPGLVITVSDLITTSEYHDLWSNRDRSLVFGFNWINEAFIQDSELYSESVQNIFSLMHQHFTSIQQPTLNQNASCTLSRSPIEPESGTNVASSCHLVTPSSKEFVPSYQNSLCGQQSFVNSIEASTNATKL